MGGAAMSGGTPGIAPAVLRVLERHGELSQMQVTELGAFNASTVRHVLPRLRKKRLVHVVRWEILHKTWAPIYAAGPGENAIKIPLAKSVKNKRYTDKQRRKQPIITSGPWAGLGA